MFIKSNNQLECLRRPWLRLLVAKGAVLHITRRNARRSLRSLGLRHIFTSATLRQNVAYAGNVEQNRLSAVACSPGRSPLI